MQDFAGTAPDSRWVLHCGPRVGFLLGGAVAGSLKIYPHRPHHSDQSKPSTLYYAPSCFVCPCICPSITFPFMRGPRFCRRHILRHVNGDFSFLSKITQVQGYKTRKITLLNITMGRHEGPIYTHA